MNGSISPGLEIGTTCTNFVEILIIASVMTEHYIFKEQTNLTMENTKAYHEFVFFLKSKRSLVCLKTHENITTFISLQTIS